MIYCQRCAADLSRTPTNRCPKCAKLFDRTNPKTYNISQHPSLYRPWYRFTRFPVLWTAAVIVTFLGTVVAGNGIAPIGNFIYHDFADHLTPLPTMTMYLAALWAVLLLPLLALRKPGMTRKALSLLAPPVFVIGIAAAITLNIALNDPQTPPLVYILPGIGWPAICLWSLAAAIDWHPFFRPATCALVILMLIVYWAFIVFPPPPGHRALHPITFIASVPFFAAVLTPAIMTLWMAIAARRKSRPKKPVVAATAEKKQTPANKPRA